MCGNVKRRLTLRIYEQYEEQRPYIGPGGIFGQGMLLLGPIGTVRRMRWRVKHAFTVSILHAAADRLDFLYGEAKLDSYIESIKHELYASLAGEAGAPKWIRRSSGEYHCLIPYKKAWTGDKFMHWKWCGICGEAVLFHIDLLAHEYHTLGIYDPTRFKIGPNAPSMQGKTPPKK